MIVMVVFQHKKCKGQCGLVLYFARHRKRTASAFILSDSNLKLFS